MCHTHVDAGDFSQKQLLRVNRQALVLHKYYELLAQAITAYRENGSHYLVCTLASQAGKVLGEEVVVASTVRYWHAEYVSRGGTFRPDERGHHTRELLIMEEDIKNKFIQWSLRKAKHDDLSVEAARDYLNSELLVTLEERAHAIIFHALPSSTVLLASVSPTMIIVLAFASILSSGLTQNTRCMPYVSV